MSQLIYRDYGNYFNLLVDSDPMQGDVVLVEDTKPHCSTLLKAFNEGEVSVKDNATGNNYNLLCSQALQIMAQGNVEYERVVINKMNLSLFVLTWARQLAGIGKVVENELVNNSEHLSLIVYPTIARSGNFTIETDNPGILQDIISLKTITTDGVIKDLQLLSDKNAPCWKVGYAILNASTTCMRTELKSCGRINYSYDFLSSILSVLQFILSLNFQPNWY